MRSMTGLIKSADKAEVRTDDSRPARAKTYNKILRRTVIDYYRAVTVFRDRRDRNDNHFQINRSGNDRG